MAIASVLTILVASHCPGLILEIPEARDFGTFVAIPVGWAATVQVGAEFNTAEVKLWGAQVGADGLVALDTLALMHRFQTQNGAEADLKFKTSEAIEGTMWLLIAEAMSPRGERCYSAPLVVYIPPRGFYPGDMVAPAASDTQLR